MQEKDLNITEVRGAKANISDLKVFGNGDTFALLCKASSQDQGWMKSTKVCNLFNGCIVQVSTQQKNPDGSYVVAEALTFVPDVNMRGEKDNRYFSETVESQNRRIKGNEQVVTQNISVNLDNINVNDFIEELSSLSKIK